MWHPLWPLIYQTINSRSCDNNPCIPIGLLSWLVCRWQCVASALHVHSMEPPSQWIIGLSSDQFEQATSSASDWGKRNKKWVESLHFRLALFFLRKHHRHEWKQRASETEMKWVRWVERDTRCAPFRSDSLDGDSQAWRVAWGANSKYYNITRLCLQTPFCGLWVNSLFPPGDARWWN